MISIRQATTTDAELIQTLAEATWWPVYEPILGPEQVRYMLNAFYSTDVITEQLNTGSQTYLLLYDGDTAKGFAAYAPRNEDPSIYKLHKLYCLPSEQGKGYGRQLIAAVENAVLTSGNNILELNVNRYNNAKLFYEHIGYKVIYIEDINIGNGYEMNDYVMRKELHH